MAVPKAKRVPPELKVEMVAIGDLRPLQLNPRRGDVDFIRESMRRHGQYVPIIARRETGEILKGNHTWHAAKAEGVTHIAVVWRSIERDADAQRFALADNRASDRAGYDVAELAEALRALDDLEGSGYDAGDLDGILKEAQAALDAGRPDMAEPPTPEKPKNPITKPGDLIELGDHRLLCGDATEPDAWDTLMGGKPASLVFTDPPYGVSYRDTGAGNARSKAKLKQKGVVIVPRFEAIEGDDLKGEELLGFLVQALGLAAEHADPHAAFYVWHASRTATIFEAAIGAIGYEIRAQIVWNKSRPAFNMAQYKYRHEPAFYAFRRGHAPGWYGDRTQTTVWDVASESGSTYQHPTQKPVALARAAILNSSAPGEIVCDPFAGAGMTLLCAAQLDRRGYAMELSPGYCDVIVSRWEEMTGHKATRPQRATRRRKKAA